MAQCSISTVSLQGSVSGNLLAYNKCDRKSSLTLVHFQFKYWKSQVAMTLKPHIR